MKFRDIYYEKKIMKKVYISILCVVAGVISGAYIVGKNILKKLSEVRLISDKHLTLFILTVQWIKVKQQGKNVSDFLKEEGYENIAIYGMSYIGERLIDELKNTDINVVYGIDRNINFISSSIDLVSINDNLKTVELQDAIDSCPTSAIRLAKTSESYESNIEDTNASPIGYTIM